MPCFCIPKYTSHIVADFRMEAITSSSYLEYSIFQHKAAPMVKLKELQQSIHSTLQTGQKCLFFSKLQNMPCLSDLQQTGVLQIAFYPME